MGGVELSLGASQAKQRERIKTIQMAGRACAGTEAGMVNLRNKKMVAGRQESVRGQGTIESSRGGHLISKREPQKDQGPRKMQKQTHTSSPQHLCRCTALYPTAKNSLAVSIHSS